MQKIPKKLLTIRQSAGIITSVVRHGTNIWGISSAGRALAWHARGQRFDPAILHHTVRTRTRFFTKKGSGTFFVYGRFCGKSTQSSKQAKAGYHHGGGTLPFALHPLYCTFRVNRCVRPYMAGTHVRRKKGRFLHIGVFFRLSVWYTRFSSTNRNLLLLRHTNC